MKKVLCNKCNYEITICNFKKHHDACLGNGPARANITKTLPSSTLCCEFCNKKCSNDNSYRNHTRCCPENPNRNYVNGMVGKVSHKKGKTKDTDESIKRQAKSFKAKIVSGEYIPHRTPHTKECKEGMSLIMQGKMQNRYTASKRIEYNGIKFESSWEYAVAIDLDANDIKWTRPAPILYKDINDQQRRYYPDFYLVDYDVYLDPKNDYVKKLDADKITAVQLQNNVKIILLGKLQLKWDAIKDLINNI